VGRVDAHPYWHADVMDAEERKSLFKQEFPTFFPTPSQPPPAKAPSTPPPPPVPMTFRDLPAKDLIRLGVDLLVELELRLTKGTA
jgi:hypothetical protein